MADFLPQEFCCTGFRFSSNFSVGQKRYRRKFKSLYIFFEIKRSYNACEYTRKEGYRCYYIFNLIAELIVAKCCRYMGRRDCQANHDTNYCLLDAFAPPRFEHEPKGWRWWLNSRNLFYLIVGVALLITLCISWYGYNVGKKTHSPDKPNVRNVSMDDDLINDPPP